MLPLLWVGLLQASEAAIPLAHVAPDSLTLPDGSFEPADERIPITGPWKLVGSSYGIRSYEAVSPIRTRALFFYSAPDRMVLEREGAPLLYGAAYEDADRPGTWMAASDSITVRLAPTTPAPKAGEYFLTYPKAIDREKDLHKGSSGLSDLDFLHQSFQVGERTRSGLYLPAPAEAVWTVTIPENGIFTTDLGIVPPEVDQGERSDGATLEVTVDGELVTTEQVTPGSFRTLKVDLSAWAGKTVKFGLRTVDDNPEADFVQLGDPILYRPQERPRRVVLVFVDTLRRDHLPFYGYERETTPHLAERIGNAVLFEDARSVAPWTLPSTRSLLTGKQPESWETAENLPGILSKKGWATGAFVGNVYLSTNFEMDRGWGEHSCINWPYAEVAVHRAVDFLNRHAGQDSLLMVHFMDMHLPYKEPYSYRHLFVEQDPPYLPSTFLRPTLMNAAGGHKAELRTYLMGRYDQNLRYIDDSLEALFKAVGPDATIVFFADHGEEFFDHGDLEHGHTLYDELIRVPLAIWSPGLSGRRVPEPVSLLDVTPTLLDLLGYGGASLDGYSLLKIAKGEADERFVNRPRAFGRPLYGEEAWGSVLNTSKYLQRKGGELIFDLQKDPQEEHNFRASRDPVPLRAAMAAGLNRPVVTAWRITPNRPGGKTTVDFTVPAGIAEAWVGEDPLAMSEATIERLDPTTVRIRFDGTLGQQREVYVLPQGNTEELSSTASIKIALDGVVPVPLAGFSNDGSGESLATLRVNGRNVQVTYAVVPRPEGKGTEGMDPELQTALQQLGYISREGEDQKTPE